MQNTFVRTRTQLPSQARDDMVSCIQLVLIPSACDDTFCIQIWIRKTRASDYQASCTHSIENHSHSDQTADVIGYISEI